MKKPINIMFCRARVVKAFQATLLALAIISCGREAKISIVDNYRPTPIQLADIGTVPATKGSPTFLFSTFIPQGTARLILDVVGKSQEVAFANQDLLDCRVSEKDNRLNVAIRFSNASSGSFGLNLQSSFNSQQKNVQYYESIKINRVAYQNSEKKNFLMDSDGGKCQARTTFLSGKEVRLFLTCPLRGVDSRAVLSGSVSCHVFEGVK